MLNFSINPRDAPIVQSEKIHLFHCSATPSEFLTSGMVLGKKDHFVPLMPLHSNVFALPPCFQGSPPQSSTENVSSEFISIAPSSKALPAFASNSLPESSLRKRKQITMDSFIKKGEIFISATSTNCDEIKFSSSVGGYPSQRIHIPVVYLSPP